MNSLESINQKLQMAATALDQATHEMGNFSMGPEHVRGLREALGNILHVQHEIYRSHENNEPKQLEDEAVEPAPGMTPEETRMVENLSAAELQEIDALLLSYAKRSWRKVAMLVALAMAQEIHQEGIPDVFYSQRVRKLVEDGYLEAQGNLQHMRLSEVRLPAEGRTPEA